MDTIHDLGGREGFGPVEWQSDNDEKLFHEPWQARSWAICMIMFGTFRSEKTGWTLDWTRHVLERISPANYLAMNYFDKWTQHMMALLIDQGTANVADFVDGHSKSKPPVIEPIDMVATETGDAEFSIGDSVVTKQKIGSMHTRLPGFARGCKGVIEAHHGLEVLADDSAVGALRKEHLYTVIFESTELWPEDGGRSFDVRVDLWESYLETP